jgi:hypothetical protein
MILHPAFSYISRFADGDLRGMTRTWVTRHLARCVRCRATLTAIRGTAADARDAPAPAPSFDLLDRILARRRAGERVILPMADPPPGPWRWRHAARVAAAIAVLLTSGVALRAAQGWGELEFAPARPVRGARLVVQYHEASRFAGAERLTLLGRYRTADDSVPGAAAPAAAVAALVSDGNGTFRGSVQLPEDVVYAAFTVAAVTGGADTRAGQPRWEVLTHRDGRPEPAALAQQRIELIGRLPSLNK